MNVQPGHRGNGNTARVDNPHLGGVNARTAGVDVAARGVIDNTNRGTFGGFVDRGNGREIPGTDGARVTGHGNRARAVPGTNRVETGFVDRGNDREIPGTNGIGVTYSSPRISRFWPRVFYRSPEVYYHRVPTFTVGFETEFRSEIGRDSKYKYAVITNDMYHKINNVVKILAIAAAIFVIVGFVLINPPLFSTGISFAMLSLITFIFNESLNKKIVEES